MYKRNHSKLLRILSVFFALIFSISSLQTSHAVELYTPAKAWYLRTNTNQAYVKHYEYSLNNAYKLSYVYPNASIVSGYSIWETNTADGVRVYNAKIYTMNESSRIVHMVPTETYWRSLFSDNFRMLTTAAITLNYDTNGTQIINTNISTTTSGIKSSNIYYRPPMDDEYSSLSTLSTTEFAALIAHEIGHALGFGHTYDTSSVMYAGTPSNTLNQNDKTALYIKYPST